MTCLAIIPVIAAMIVDGDTARGDAGNVRLTQATGAPFDAPETWKPQCRSEARLGAQATGYVRAAMPGTLCIIGRGNGGYGRDLGVLFDSDGRDVGAALVAAGLARVSRNADWCG